MTAVTTAQPMRKTRNRQNVRRGSGVVLTADTIYLGALVQRNASGKIANLTDNTTAKCVGIAVQGVGMTSSGTYVGDGTIVCEFEFGHEILISLSTAVTVGLTGSAFCYAKDNNMVVVTAAAATTNGSSCGLLEEFVSANLGWVSIRAGVAMTKGT